MKPTAEETIKQYVAAWNGSNLEEFKTEFAKCWAAGATYTDPNFDIMGVDAIAELAQASLEKFPGRNFWVVTLPEYHHNVALYTWGVEIPGVGNNQGRDYIEFDEEHKIARLVSFFPPL